jgi:hypothetical protein
MSDFVLNLHSGWRFIVLLAIAVTFLYFIYAYFTKQTSPKQDKMVAVLFGVALDIQITLGILLLLIVIIDGRFDAGTHLGHLFPMLIAVGVAHVPSAYNRKTGGADRRRLHLIGIAAPIIVIILIIGGLASLDGIGLFTMS